MQGKASASAPQAVRPIWDGPSAEGSDSEEAAADLGCLRGGGIVAPLVNYGCYFVGFLAFAGFRWAAAARRGLSQYALLQRGQMRGCSSPRGAHSWPHRSHRYPVTLSSILAMCRTLPPTFGLRHKVALAEGMLTVISGT